MWDYQKIGAGIVIDGFAADTEIGLFALKRDIVNRYLQHFKEVNVEVHTVQMAPLVLCNFICFDLLNQGGLAAPSGEEGAEEAEDTPTLVAALDIGTDNTNLVITDGNSVFWQRPIPFGGNHFTLALAKDFKLPFAQAEHLKRNANKSPDLKKNLASLKPVLNDFVGEVQCSLRYFTNSHGNARIVYMVGLGNAFRLPGLQEFLSENLRLEVRRPENFERLGGDAVAKAPSFRQNIMSFATCYGLALQGLGATPFKTNLLPPEIEFERMIRAKDPAARQSWKVRLIQALFEGGLNADDFRQLFRLIDWMMDLPSELEDAVRQQVRQARA